VAESSPPVSSGEETAELVTSLAIKIRGGAYVEKKDHKGQLTSSWLSTHLRFH
jgi:hypothetical protein